MENCFDLGCTWCLENISLNLAIHEILRIISRIIQSTFLTLKTSFEELFFTYTVIAWQARLWIEFIGVRRGWLDEIHCAFSICCP